MDTVVTSVTDMFSLVTGHIPRFRVHGGTTAENLALQNIQVSITTRSHQIANNDAALFRPDFGWFSPTCSLRYFLGLVERKAGCWFLVA
jgi:hypothetical protein